MGETDATHAGIDLDVICIRDLLDQDSGAETRSRTGAIRSDPGDLSVFVTGIFKKMQGRPAFLSFSRQISDVNQILTMKYSSADDIARVILRDLALTSQVLKLVNSSVYRHFARKGIATISEAMIILGTDEVREMAASLKIYEMMKDMAGSRVLKDKTLKGLQRSIMARHLADDQGSCGSDALPVSAMIYDLGEYLVALFDPERYIEIDLLMDTQGLGRAEASKSVLGLSYSDLGRVMAAKLNLPESIVQAIRPVTGFSTNGKELTHQERARYLCAMIYELCDIPMDDDPDKTAGEVADKYWDVLGIDLRQAVSLMKTSHEKMLRHAELLNVDPVMETKAAKTCGIRNKAALTEGLNRVKEALDAELSIHEIFTRIVTIMDRCFHFDQVVLSIRKKQTSTMEPRYVKGKRSSPEIYKVLDFKILRSSPDLFNIAIARKTDMVVRDIGREAYKKQVPEWYLKKVSQPYQVQGFAVFPVFVRDKLVAMIYVDWNKKTPALGQDTMEYIHVFRELMVKTFTLHAR